jgi:uncharacterized repeat protein (TIGR01451 family)
MFALLAAMPLSAFAAGTAAGTAISNTATLECDLCGAGGQTTSTTPFVVDEKINLTVGGGSNLNVNPGATAQVSTFTVTNHANSTLDFSLAIAQIASPADQFDAASCGVYVESGATPGYQSAQDIATFIDELVADASATVYAVCDIPSPLLNADISQVDLSATALGNFTGVGGVYAATPGAPGAALIQTAAANDPGAVDIAFADIAGTAAGDALRDATHSARNTFTAVSAAAVGLTKIITKIEDTLGCSASVCSILSGTTSTYQCVTSSGSSCKVTTGSVITYRVDYVATGGGAINDVALTDPIIADMTYVPGSLTVNGVAKTDAADADNAAFCSAITVAAPCNVGAPNTVTVTPGNITAPMSLWFTFRATIN